MYDLSFISTILIVGLSTAVIAQLFKIKKLRKLVEQVDEIENDEGVPVYVEFTDGIIQKINGVKTVSEESIGFTLRAPAGNIVATFNSELIRATYAEHAVTTEEASE